MIRQPFSVTGHFGPGPEREPGDPIRCRVCGEERTLDAFVCPTCNGSGETVCLICFGVGREDGGQWCQSCKGTGVGACPACEGTGDAAWLDELLCGLGEEWCVGPICRACASETPTPWLPAVAEWAEEVAT